MEDRIVHFSEVVSLTKMFSTGEGACGEQGEVTGYSGLVTCQCCIEIANGCGSYKRPVG